MIVKLSMAFSVEGKTPVIMRLFTVIHTDGITLRTPLGRAHVFIL